MALSLAKEGCDIILTYRTKKQEADDVVSEITGMGRKAVAISLDMAIRNNPQVKATLSGLSPLNRVGHASDIGGVVAFLCSSQAAWINGQRIEVSGGIHL